MEPEVVNKRVAQSVNEYAVAQRFSAAAKHYHDFDTVQKITSTYLFNQMAPKGNLLDIGAGPGTDFSQFADVNAVIALDIAPGMLTQLKHDFPEYQTVCANAESIPLAPNSVDSVYSNLALQWCGNLSLSLNDTARVLKPKGEYHLAIVAQDSLLELSQLGLRVNEFRGLDEIVSHFDPSLWLITSAKIQSIRVHFADLKTLLYSIKGVGASINAKDNPKQVLRGRGDWQKLLCEAESHRTPEGMPLTYEIAFISATCIGV